MTLLQRVRYIWRRVGLTLLIAMPVAMYLTFRPWGVDPRVLASSGEIAVTEASETITFVPSKVARSGLILLPGCPVDARAYAPLIRRVAERGHLGVVVRVPYRCAPFAAAERTLEQRVQSARRRYPDIPFVLAGHSRGGALVARLAAGRRIDAAAYVLIGTSHPRDDDLRALSTPVVKIAATNDGVAGEAQFATERLPPTTKWVRIEGGNHSQFAHYGFQLFDHRATISREAQQAQVVEALHAALAAAADQTTAPR